MFECAWDGCDYQFEDQDDLLTHVTETSGHLQAQSKYSNLCSVGKVSDYESFSVGSIDRPT